MAYATAFKLPGDLAVFAEGAAEGGFACFDGVGVDGGVAGEAVADDVELCFIE